MRGLRRGLRKGDNGHSLPPDASHPPLSNSGVTGDAGLELPVAYAQQRRTAELLGTLKHRATLTCSTATK